MSDRRLRFDLSAPGRGLLLAPALLALVTGGLGLLLSTSGSAWAHIISALLLSAPRLCMLLYPAMAILWLARPLMGRKGPPLQLSLSVGVVGLLATGTPMRGAPEGLSVLTSNVQAFAEGEEELAEFLDAQGADVLFQVEVRVEELPTMRRVAHNFDDGLPMRSYGLGIYCREGLECEGEIVKPVDGVTCPMPLGLLRVSDDLCIMAVHVPPPMPVCIDSVEPYVDAVASRLADGGLADDWGPCDSSDELLLVGDFNGTRGGSNYRAFADRGFDDPRANWGMWGATWPAGGGWPNLPVLRLDHAFAGEGVEVNGISQLSVPGADHKALVVHVER